MNGVDGWMAGGSVSFSRQCLTQSLIGSLPEPNLKTLRISSGAHSQHAPNKIQVYETEFEIWKNGDISCFCFSIRSRDYLQTKELSVVHREVSTCDRVYLLTNVKRPIIRLRGGRPDSDSERSACIRRAASRRETNKKK